MDGGTTKEVNQHLLAARISTEIKDMLEYSSFFYELQKVTASEEVSAEDFQSTLLKSVKTGFLNVKLRNMVYHWLRERCIGFKPAYAEPLDYMKKAQETWESRIWKSLTTMAHELKTPLACGRLVSEQEAVEENWSELSQWDVDLSKFKPVYSPKDFLDCLLHIASPNYKGVEKCWGSLANVPLKVKTLRELKCLFGDLTTGEPHYGLIRHLDSRAEFYGSYLSTGLPKVIQHQRCRLGEAVDARGSAVVAQEFLKKGCPPALRGRLWQQVLGSNITQEHRDYYQTLKQAVVKSDLLVDRLILKDVQLTAANDDQYFVFEDSLYKVLLCFSRDVSLLDLFERSSKNPLTASIKRNKGRLTEGSVIYPPNGIIPFHGFTILRVVFKWLMKGFSGYLPAEQVLQLWDLILGYNSIQLLSFFALGILSIRKENLIRAQQPQTVDAVLADLSSVAVLPVLQLVLYKETF